MKRWFEKYRYWMNVPAMLLLGMFLIVAGVGKLLYNSNSFASYPFLESLPLTQALYLALPYIEIAIGLMLIHGFMVKFAATMAGSMVAVFAISNILLINVGKGFELCGCFGMAGSLTYVDALVIDFIMAVLVAAVFICHRGRYFNLTPWFLEPGDTLTKQRA